MDGGRGGNELPWLTRSLGLSPPHPSLTILTASNTACPLLQELCLLYPECSVDGAPVRNPSQMSERGQVDTGFRGGGARSTGVRYLKDLPGEKRWSPGGQSSCRQNHVQDMSRTYRGRAAAWSCLLLLLGAVSSWLCTGGPLVASPLSFLPEDSS